MHPASPCSTYSTSLSPAFAPSTRRRACSRPRQSPMKSLATTCCIRRALRDDQGHQGQNPRRERPGSAHGADRHTVYFADAPVFAYHNDPEKTKRAYNVRGWSTLADIGHDDAYSLIKLAYTNSAWKMRTNVNITSTTSTHDTVCEAVRRHVHGRSIIDRSDIR